MKNKYFIANLGCDDHTDFTLELTDEELKTIIRFCDENNKVADYQCKPEICIFKYNQKNSYYAYNDEDQINKGYSDLKEGNKE